MPSSTALAEDPLEERASPSPREQQLLHALSHAWGVLESLNAEYRQEVERQQEARAAHIPIPHKSPDQERIEEERRSAKLTIQGLIDRLAMGRMYARSEIIKIARQDGSVSPRSPLTQAISQADLAAALAGLNNDTARRVFWDLTKGQLDPESAARGAHTTPEAVPRLFNIALDHIDRALNEPVMAEMRALYMPFCLEHGLEWPDYARLRHR